ncbi:hypothetical protein GDO86_000394, partial [Hymenochirus boettgeri]
LVLDYFLAIFPALSSSLHPCHSISPLMAAIRIFLRALCAPRQPSFGAPAHYPSSGPLPPPRGSLLVSGAAGAAAALACYVACRDHGNQPRAALPHSSLHCNDNGARTLRIPSILMEVSAAKETELNQVLLDTPPIWKGSSRFFRTLDDKGMISYTEYLFLLCILTKPHAGFKIAFNMFDTDGNQMVDREEFLVLQEIFRKKNEKKERKGEEEKCAQLRLQLYGYLATTNGVHKTDVQEHVSRSYWDTLRRNTSQALFSDLAEGTDELISSMIHTTLLVHFFGKKGKLELNFDDFYKFMDNLQTEVLEIEFLSYSKGMNTISEEDFAHILLRYTNVENTSSYLENVRFRIPEEKGISFDEFRSFFQFLNNLEDFAIAMQMYNFANRSIGQDEFKRAVYVATGLKLSPHLVNTVFKIFDVDKDDQLSYKEFIGIMKDRLHRGFREPPKHGLNDYYRCVTSVTRKHFREFFRNFRSRDLI